MAVLLFAACGDSALEGIDQARRFEQAGNRPMAIEAYRKVLEDHPENPKALVGLSDLLLETGKAGEAEPLIARALKVAPQDAGPHYVRGRYLLLQKLWLQAEQELEQASRIDLFDPDIQFYLGIALERMGEKEKAIPVFQKVLTLKPDYPYVHQHLAGLYFLQGAYDRAAQEYEEAIEERPKEVKLLEQLALTYYYLHFNESAERIARRVLALDPKSSGAYNILGSVAFAGRKIDEAQKHFEQAIALDPKIVAAHANLGAIFNVKGQPDKAMAEFKKVLELDPSNVPVRKNLGDLYVAQKKYPDALEQYRLYLQAQPDDAYVNYLAAKIVALVIAEQPDDGIHFIEAFDRITGVDIALNEIRFAMTTKREKPTGQKLDEIALKYSYLPDVFAVRAILFERKKDLEGAREAVEIALLMNLDETKKAAFKSRLEAYKKGVIPPPPPSA
jgi:tetratricopeptide (TPR) repeat protein